MKKFVTLLAVIGFAMSAAALPEARVERKETRKDKKEITETETPAQAKAKDKINAARVDAENRSISKTALTSEELNLIKNEGTKAKLESMIKNFDTKVNSDDNFTVRVSVLLIKSAKANPNEAEQAQILRFVDESFTLMTLGGESGKSARDAMTVLAKELASRTKLDDAIYASMKAAFPKLSETELQAKIKEFKASCLGAQA